VVGCLDFYNEAPNKQMFQYFQLRIKISNLVVLNREANKTENWPQGTRCCESSGCHNSRYEDYGLLWCDKVHTRRQVPPYLRNQLSPSSAQKSMNIWKRLIRM